MQLKGIIKQPSLKENGVSCCMKRAKEKYHRLPNLVLQTIQ